MTTSSDRPQTGQFLAPAEVTSAAQAIFEDDLEELGFVMNVSRLWAYRPDIGTSLFALMAEALSGGALTRRDGALLVAATASTLGDSYCSVAWGTKLAAIAGPAVAAGVLRGDDQALSPAEQAMTAWARMVARDANAVTADDVQPLRAAGFSEASIFAMTTFVALRIAFSTVNDALGVCPDAEYHAMAPPAVLAAITYGRPIGGRQQAR
jgi:uncharacterized peroxidase-related enzyme